MHLGLPMLMIMQPARGRVHVLPGPVSVPVLVRVCHHRRARAGRIARADASFFVSSVSEGVVVATL